MKPRLAAVLSIAGVLSAGSVAALVNTQVLDTGGAAGSSASTPAASAGAAPGPVPSPTVPSTTPPGRAGTPASAPATTTVATSATTPPPTSPAAPAIGVYDLGEAGTVTLSTAGDVLTIVSVDPAPGWSVKEAEHEDAHDVEVRLRSDDREVKFEANLLFGVVNASLEHEDEHDDD